MSKPPLGVMPESIWRENRMTVLASAIVRYLDYHRYNSDICDLEDSVVKWAEELKLLAQNAGLRGQDDGD